MLGKERTEDFHPLLLGGEGPHPLHSSLSTSLLQALALSNGAWPGTLSAPAASTPLLGAPSSQQAVVPETLLDFDGPAAR